MLRGNIGGTLLLPEPSDRNKLLAKLARHESAWLIRSRLKAKDVGYASAWTEAERQKELDELLEWWDALDLLDQLELD